MSQLSTINYPLSIRFPLAKKQTNTLLLIYELCPEALYSCGTYFK